MNIIFICESEGKAVESVRKILDRYCSRIGTRVWEAALTEEGLGVIQTLLKRKSSPKMAIACHRITYNGRRKLAWTVGNRDRFFENGQVSTATTKRHIIPLEVNPSIQMRIMKLLVMLAGLFHDLGKATIAFQSMILSGKGLEAYRHELISMWIVEALIDTKTIKDDESAFKEIESNLNQEFSSINEKIQQTLKILMVTPPKENEKAGFLSLDNTAIGLKSLMWLILSHHRLPNPKDDSGKIPSASLSAYCRLEPEQAIQNSFKLVGKGLPWGSDAWLYKTRQALSSLRLLLLEAGSLGDDFFDSVRHMGRLALQIGDHHVSSLKEADRGYRHENGVAYANPIKVDGKSVGAQKLHRHLIDVGRQAVCATSWLTTLESTLASVDEESFPKLITKSSKSEKFDWQNKAVKAMKSHAGKPNEAGFFGVLMAETGTGKTIAAPRILCAGQKKIRFVFAHPMRSLTLQTADVLQSIGFRPDQFSTVIGDPLIQQLHNFNKISEFDAVTEDDDNLETVNGSIQTDFNDKNHLVMRASDYEKVFLSTPILSSTVDSLIRMADGRRGGHILQAIRLASSDIILDEIDMYSPEDLVVIGRLIEAAGFWRRRVLLLSATIAPQIAEGLFCAYWRGFHTRNALEQETMGLRGGWFSNRLESKIVLVDSVNRFVKTHDEYTNHLANEILSFGSGRRYKTLPITDEEIKERVNFHDVLCRDIFNMHSLNHILDPESGKRVSVGCVQVVNVGDAKALALKLLKAQTNKCELRIVCTHSHQSLIVRNYQEHRLNKMLDRGVSEFSPLKDPSIRKAIGVATEKNICDVIIVVVSTLESTGRNHDFDWGVQEARDLRSIIQFAGRIRRHREPIDVINLAVLNIPIFDKNRLDPFTMYGVNDRIFFSNKITCPFSKLKSPKGTFPKYKTLLDIAFGILARIHAAPLVKRDHSVEHISGTDVLSSVEQGRLFRALLHNERDTPVTLVEWLFAHPMYRMLSSHPDRVKFRNGVTEQFIIWKSKRDDVWMQAGIDDLKHAQKLAREPTTPEFDTARLLFDDFDEDAEIDKFQSSALRPCEYTDRLLTGIRRKQNPEEFVKGWEYHPLIGPILK